MTTIIGKGMYDWLEVLMKGQEAAQKRYVINIKKKVNPRLTTSVWNEHILQKKKFIVKSNKI